jgi:hypothetical protein
VAENMSGLNLSSRPHIPLLRNQSLAKTHSASPHLRTLMMDAMSLAH